MTLEITRGDDEYLDIVARKLEVPVSLTDVDLWFYLKRAVNDSDDDAVIRKTAEVDGGIIINPDQSTYTGQAEVKISASDTSDLQGDFLYELQARDTFGDTQTLASGTITIRPDVVRA